MGERWSFMILRAAFNGVHHFEEFQQELNIARNILSNRLSRDFRLDAVARRRTMLPIAFPKIAKCSGHRAIKFRIAIAPT